MTKEQLAVIKPIVWAAIEGNIDAQKAVIFNCADWLGMMIAELDLQWALNGTLKRDLKAERIKARLMAAGEAER